MSSAAACHAVVAFAASARPAYKHGVRAARGPGQAGENGHHSVGASALLLWKGPFITRRLCNASLFFANTVSVRVSVAGEGGDSYIFHFH